MTRRFTTDDWLRLSFLLYVFLWITEGAARKWLVPSLSIVLLYIRDPIAVASIGLSIWKGRFTVGLLSVSLLIVTLLSLATSLLVHDSAIVSIFGARTVALPFLYCFAIAPVIDTTTLRRVVYLIWVFAIPTAFIVYMQFNSAPDSMWNADASGGFNQITGVNGKVRPSGTFSSIAGLTCYVGLLASIGFSGLGTRRVAVTVVSAVGLLCVLVCASFSISRSQILTIGIIGAVFLCLKAVQGLRLSDAVWMAAFLAFTPLVLLNGSVREGIEAMGTRWELASDFEGGVETRISSILSVSGGDFERAGPLGNGLGLGTSFGSMFSTGDRVFNLAENEWPRVVLEMGYVLGTGYIVWRILFLMYLFFGAAKASLMRNPARLLLLTATAPLIFNGQLYPPANSGAVSIGALLAMTFSQSVFDKWSAEKSS